MSKSVESENKSLAPARFYAYFKGVSIELDEVRAALAALDSPAEAPAGKNASVAGIFVPDPLRLLFIRRAQHDGDPWSGHMAFPGGRHDPGDVDLMATALRETREEIGVELDDAEFLGALPDVQARPRFELTIRPHFFALEHVPSLTPNHEVAEVHFAEVGPLFRGERDAVRPWKVEGRAVDFPAYEVEGRLVWGLTYLMVRRLFVALQR